MKKTRILASVLALAMCVSAMPMSAFAVPAPKVEEVGAGKHSVEVTVSSDSTYSVAIPKKMTITPSEDNTVNFTYDILVHGEIAGTEKLVVTPDATFLLAQQGKNDVTATITQTTTEWVCTELKADTEGIYHGTITAENVTAGTWTGSFNFNIALEEASIELITFTIDGTSYQAKEGMTWAEWVESEYNTIGATISDGNAGVNGLAIVKNGSVTQYDLSVILSNQAYEIGPDPQ